MSLNKSGQINGKIAQKIIENMEHRVDKSSTIAIAMSGGIDSTAVAMFLVDAGYHCFGVSMKLFDDEQDILLAKNLANTLGIEHHVVDLSKSFKDIVVNQFADSYNMGRTPNPCVICNEHIKFGKLLDYALDNGAELMVTGHYARVYKDEITQKYLLLKGKASRKDQAYPLHRLSQKQLSKLVFPLGEINNKKEIYDMLITRQLIHPRKDESMGICFAPVSGYTSLLQEIAPNTVIKGNICDISGNIIGEHSGTANYTIGQKKGIDINFHELLKIYPDTFSSENVIKKSNYVVLSIDAKNNSIVVGDEKYLYKTKIYLNDVNVISGNISDILHKKYTWKHCHWGYFFTGRLMLSDIDDYLYVILCDQAQRGATNGQYAVCYDGDRVLGGGCICGSSYDPNVKGDK